jgi:hypothetical protein
MNSTATQKKGKSKKDPFCCFYLAYRAAEGDPPAQRILFFFSWSQLSPKTALFWLFLVPTLAIN